MRTCVAVAVMFAAAATSANSPLDIAQARLALMRDVAAYKHSRGLPIADSEREARVLEGAHRAALENGLQVDGIEKLFAAQIEAAKGVQAYWFEQWSRTDAPRDAPDLVQTIRPRLIELGNDLLAGLAAEGCCPEGSKLTLEGLPPAEGRAVVAALRAAVPYRNRLAQVLQSGVLRVGTTGDYAPFSFRGDAASAFVGADIDLARDLAATLDARLELVPTTWPTLLADLQAGRFDVAMSGVSRTLVRQRVGYFSAAYHVGGKTPIARCEVAHSFDTVAAIDRPEVRVVVNPGGTNERFVDQRLSSATKVMHEDNRSIFDRIAAGDVDVMVTDRIEVTLQAARKPGVLCSATEENFTYQEKAYLMPQDDPWREYVDAWLSKRLQDGSVARALHLHTR